jgi:hypothetical protein
MAIPTFGILLLLLLVIALVCGFVMLAIRPVVGVAILGALFLLFVLGSFGLYAVRSEQSMQATATLAPQPPRISIQSDGRRAFVDEQGRVIEILPGELPHPSLRPMEVVSGSTVTVAPEAQHITGNADLTIASQAVIAERSAAEAARQASATPSTVPTPTAEAVPTAPSAAPIASSAVPVAPSAAPTTPSAAVPDVNQQHSNDGHDHSATAPTVVVEKLPEGRPAWVDQTNHREAQTYQATVRSGLFVTFLECERAVDRLTKNAVDEYIDQDLGDGASAVVQIEPDFIKRNLRKGFYHEEVQASVGPMQQVHALLVIDDAARATFHDRWHQVLVQRRLWHVGSGALLAIVLLGTLFSYLKLDLKSAGAHSRRLQFTAAVTILLAVAGAVMANRMVPF